MQTPSNLVQKSQRYVIRTAIFYIVILWEFCKNKDKLYFSQLLFSRLWSPAKAIIAIIFVFQRNKVQNMGFDVQKLHFFVWHYPPWFTCIVFKAWTSCYEYYELNSEWRHDYEGEYQTKTTAIWLLRSRVGRLRLLTQSLKIANSVVLHF